VLYEGTQQIRSFPQVMEFSRETLTQFSGIAWSIIGQAGVFNIRPDLFIRVEFRGISGKFFRNHVRMFGQIRLNHLGAIVHLAAIPDNRDRTRQMMLKLTQEAHHILSMDIRIVRQQGKVQSSTFANGTDRDGTDGRDTISSIPAIVNGRLAARGQGPANGGREHETRFIRENQMRPSASSVFLYAAIPLAATAQCLSRCVPEHAVRVSGWSNLIVSSGCGVRVPDEVLSRNAGESPRLLAWPSIGRWASRALEPPVAEVFLTAEVVHRSVVCFDPEVAWRTGLLALRVPYPASDTRTDAIHRVFGRLASATRPLALASPLADGGVPVLRRFLWVSYIWYRNICLRHLRKTGSNK